MLQKMCLFKNTNVIFISFIFLNNKKQYDFFTWWRKSNWEQQCNLRSYENEWITSHKVNLLCRNKTNHEQIVSLCTFCRLKCINSEMKKKSLLNWLISQNRLNLISLFGFVVFFRISIRSIVRSEQRGQNGYQTVQT